MTKVKDQSGVLFDAEEMTRIMKDSLWAQDEDKPVTVLGRTFKNDAERRDVFRRELREKLPELKKIEGYPIGEDDDIINLSDPPYYTACPNPWLNDFIKEWEEEKKVLVRQGKREENKVVTEPYAADVSEGKNNPIYMAHAYHTKVPHPAIMRYILHYTEPGDIVFDGFAGTGMTAVAAQLCGSKLEVESLHEIGYKLGIRHGVCSDLSPMAAFIGATYTLAMNKNEFIIKAKGILDKVEKELGWLYETKEENSVGKITSTIWSDVFICPNCGNEIIYWDEAVNYNKKEIIDRFHCPQCNTECSKKNLERAFVNLYDPIIGDVVNINKKVPVRKFYTLRGKRCSSSLTVEDLSTVESATSIKILNPRFIKLKDGYNTAQPKKSNGVEYTHQFYTYRAFVYLSRVYDYVKNDIHLLAWLTSTLQSLSKMNRFRFSGTGVNAGTLYIPSLNWEFTPECTLRRKIESFAQTAYSQRGNSIVNVISATSLAIMMDNSIDYIFVDPPFGANIMYSELNEIWEGWLKVITNDKEEAIINEIQQKTLFDYQNLMNKSFKEFYRVLKPGKWLTMEFSNTSASVWNSIQNALQGVGFIISNVAALDKKQGTFKAVTTTTAVKQDLIITCYKPSAEFISKIESSTDKAMEVWDFIEDHLSHITKYKKVSNSTTAVVERSAKILYDKLISYYVSRGYPVPMDAQEFQIGLRERFEERDGMFFTVDQVAKYEEERKKTDGFVPMALMVSDESEGIEWLKRELGKEPQAYQDISGKWMQSLAKPRKGDNVPELLTLLKENFIDNPDGTWSVPDPTNAKHMEQMRISKLLHEFDIYKNHVQTKKTKLKNTRLEVLREGFKKCYKDKDFLTIIAVGDKIEQTLLEEDGILLQYYGIACQRI